MQIVIDIPEEIIKDAKDSPNYYPTYHFKEIWRAIVNGTPLPKGHGRLIDADALNFNADYNEPLISKFDFDCAPTIIEADKAESEKT